MTLLGVGFVVHALLPLRRRLPFFAALSLATVPVTFGLWDGVFLIALGLALIGICHLPFPLAARVALLLATGTLFALWRVKWLPAPWSVSIWPILGSMFMFRLALYVYALKHDDRRPGLARSIAYFFMAPNVSFPLFPVVDYATFARTHYDRDAAHIYETGMRWIARGLLHLILYRFVYHHLVIDPAEMVDLGQLAQFILSTFLLYLRVSGQFHLITGVLHLFGFRLPPTHHLYYLASSFTDFWRRINIYWKDFMTKLVYYPSFFRLRRHGTRLAAVAATVIVFAGTWLLHSYQWFWLRGGFPLEAEDGLFWGILCVLVVFGSLRDLKRPPKRSLGGGPPWSLSLALRTVGIFTTICLLWSLWSADSVIGWLMMWLVAGHATPRDLGLLAVFFAGGLLVAGRSWSMREPDLPTAQPFHRRSAVRSTAVLVGILLVGATDLYARVIPPAAAMVGSLQRSTLNVADAALQHKGYYEKLDNPSRLSGNVWALQVAKPAHWVAFGSTAAYRPRRDFVRGDLQPGSRIVFLDRPLSVNRWGMRDRDVPHAKPPGTYRIAFLGPSIVMGTGVGDDDTLTRFLEERLNTIAPDGRRYEVLNFGVADCSLVEQLALLQEQALAFEPDAVFIGDSQWPHRPLASQLLHAVWKKTPIPYPGLEELLRRTGVFALAGDAVPVPFQSVRAAFGALGVPTRMPWSEAERRMRLASDEIVQWTFRSVADVARAHGAVPVFVLFAGVGDPEREDAPALRDAADRGLIAFNLTEVWRDHDPDTLRIAPWDNHPNAAGNRLMAARLAELMQQRSGALRLGTGGERPRG
jgi:alginate O-acetyltransferase complex protein AlgI